MQNRPKIGINSTYFEDAHKWYKVPISYINAVYQAGGLPVILPCDPDEAMINEYFKELDGIVFTGGDDYPASLYGEIAGEHEDPIHPRRVETDMMLMRKVINESEMPVLGICVGHQLMAIAYGGKLVHHLPNGKFHAVTGDTEHSVEIKGGKWLKSIFKAESIIVNSNHHQAVREDHFPKEFEVTARAEDGVIEAIEMRNKRFVLGVQWHPERAKNKEHTRTIFEYFIEKTRERKTTE